MPLLRNRTAAVCVLTALAAMATATSSHGSVPGAIPDVGIDQRLDTQLPLDLTFYDEAGDPIALGDILDGSQPAVLALVYYECTMLCGEVLNGMLDVFKELELGVGTDFQAITVSFDPTETHDIAAPKKDIFVSSYGRDDADAATGWHFLTDREGAAAELAQLVGFRYTYLPDIDEYAHGSALIVLTPTGKVSRYFYGIAFPQRDVRLALVDAGEGKIGSLADQLMLLCMYYDPVTGAYSLAVMNVLRLAGGVTVLLLGSFVLLMLLRERRNRMTPASLHG